MTAAASREAVVVAENAREGSIEALQLIPVLTCKGDDARYDFFLRANLAYNTLHSNELLRRQRTSSWCILVVPQKLTVAERGGEAPADAIR